MPLLNAWKKANMALSTLSRNIFKGRQMDEITKKWFDTSTVKVVLDPSLEGWLTTDELVRLSGAPKHSTLYVAPANDDMVELRVENPDLLAEPLVRLIAQDGDEFAFFIVNAAFNLSIGAQRMGIGARSVSIELHEALALKRFTRVKTDAVGDFASAQWENPISGYLVWPLLGFDADIPSHLLSHPSFPANRQGCTRLLELLETQEGEEFWEEFGSSIKVEFDLTPDSDCWKRHKRYTYERKIEVKQ